MNTFSPQLIPSLNVPALSPSHSRRDVGVDSPRYNAPARAIAYVIARWIVAGMDKGE